MNRFESQSTALARRMALTGRIQRFIDGVDVSAEAARFIEAGLDDAFPDNARIGAAVLMLASYRPGDDTAVSEAAMVEELKVVLARLR